MVIRVDDVSANTDISDLKLMYESIKERFGDVEVWFAISLFCVRNSKGSVYPKTPFKDNEIGFFFDNDLFFNQVFYVQNTGFSDVKFVSHGMYHADHRQLDKVGQTISILSSCQYLDTDIFVPPFNRYNDDTIKVCEENDITLIKDGWKSFDCHPPSAFPDQENWYFHAWRFTPEEFDERINS